MDMTEHNSSEGVAIVGLAGRFPHAANVGQFWNNLASGTECFTEFTVEQLIAEGVPPDVAARPDYVRRGPVIEDPAGFDARLFGYSPKEAELIDPQQRILLECAWEALEHAGHDPYRFPGLVGIWAGSGVNNYYLKNILKRPGAFETVADFQAIISNDKDYLASRIAYKLNLRGPAVAVQTACSTSLVAVHMACHALLTYQCDMALAGGVSLQTPRARGYLYREGEIFSPDGVCRAFDKDANGTVLGEGCGLVVLRRLEDAIAERDNILAIIRGSVVNNDGAARAGYTAPGVAGQMELITMTQAVADIRADEISYIEAHGTGTGLGDPIEVSALTQAFRRTTAERGFCGLGSVKTNIGHLDVAAGIAGLIKTVCALQRRQLPPTLHFTEPNPELHLAESPFYVVDRLMDWQPRYGRRIAGVSSFGMGGTNAHVILEEYRGQRKTEPSRRRWHILPVSAATPAALNAIGADLAGYFKDQPDSILGDAAWTLAAGRKQQLRHRRCVITDSTAAAAVQFVKPDALFGADGAASRGERPVVFLFSGQGTQYPAMGLDIYRSEPVFRESMDHCARIIGPIGGCDSLLGILYGDDTEARALVNQTGISQPALFAFEYSLARLWESYGVRPVAVVGHSIGEYAAACEAGIMSLEDALYLVRERGRLMQSMEPGTMIAVPRSETEVRKMLPAALDLAVINAPEISVVSGPTPEIEAFTKELESRGISFRRLQTSHGFHSRTMEPAAQAFELVVQRISLKPPRIPTASNFTGGWMTDAQATDPAYWANHLRHSVRFSDNLRTVAQRFESPVLLEIGPGNTLCAIARQQEAAVAGLPTVSTVRHPRQQTPDQAFFLRALGALWCNGAAADLSSLYALETRARVVLPSYPFERERFWISHQLPARESASAGMFRLFRRQTAGTAKKESAEAGSPASRSLSQEALLALWRETIGTSAIGLDDNFFDIGGHSLLAAQLFSRIKEEFGINAPLSILFDFPTVRQLMLHLSKSKELPWRSLVPIAAAGTRVPLFLVHGAEGNVLLYRELAKHLQPDQPVFGLQCKGLDGCGGNHERIEDMASDYVAEIQAAYPQGPLIVGGYCMGGMVALEMAQQLTNQGRHVQLVMAIESYNYKGCGVRVTSWLERQHTAQNLWFHVHNVLLAGGPRGRAFIAQKLRVEFSRLQAAMKLYRGGLSRRPHLTKSAPLPHINLSKINDAAYFAYEPKPYLGKIAVFRPRKQFRGYDMNDCGWGVLAPGRTEVDVLPVNPRGMLVDPFVEELARRIRKSMDSHIQSKP
jgi:acyl transferase domain-containing protein/thioesterase domain-containing protein